VSECRVSIQWTKSAKDGLASLPRKVRLGILTKADKLAESNNPRQGHKPLTGLLANYYRLTYGRYRAIYKVAEDKLYEGATLLHITILFIAVGKRKQRDRKDIYTIAQRLVELGLVDVD